MARKGMSPSHRQGKLWIANVCVGLGVHSIGCSFSCQADTVIYFHQGLVCFEVRQAKPLKFSGFLIPETVGICFCWWLLLLCMLHTLLLLI